MAVYMDYEMCWDPVVAHDTAPNQAYTKVVGRNARVASYAYFTTSIAGFDKRIGRCSRIALTISENSGLERNA